MHILGDPYSIETYMDLDFSSFSITEVWLLTEHR